MLLTVSGRVGKASKVSRTVFLQGTDTAYVEGLHLIKE